MRTFTEFELSLFAEGYEYIAGVDESGRGPLAGPVTAAAVIFPRSILIPGVDDCKRLLPGKRDLLVEKIRAKALNWSIGTASVEEIDELNILQASRLAMKRAVEGLALKPDICLADGFPIPDWERKHIGVIKGDRLCFTIAAASILAKTHRDNLMRELHRCYPQYSFHRHKGYPTQAHRQAIIRFGTCPAHRQTFNLYGNCAERHE